MFFYQTQTKWRSRPGSFDNIVDQIISHRLQNAWIKQPTDRETVIQELDQFCANVCAQMGWGDYITGGENIPKTPPPPSSLGQRLTNVAAGAEVIVEWLDDGAEAVHPTIADKRAEVCVGCPLNGKGGLEKWFTVPASEGIRRALNSRREMKLGTSHDDLLGVCEACLCPLKLKVHIPLERIKRKLSQAVITQLHPKCWITNEM